MSGSGLDSAATLGVDLLDTRQLCAFQELARCQSFTAAARALHVTQSAVSHSIKALESTLDITLFERQGKTVALTPAGAQFQTHANEILQRMQGAIDAVEALRRPGHGRLSIGATASISHAVLPSVLREFRETFPHYEITITTENTRELLAKLVANVIDVAVGMEMKGASAYHFDPLFTDRIVMAMAPAHPLADLSTITVEHLLHEDFVVYSRDSETFHQLAQGFATLNGHRRHLQVGSMAAIKEMARMGLGIGLLAPWVAQDELDAGTLVARSLPWEGLERHWGTYALKRSERSLAEQVFCGILREVTWRLEVEDRAPITLQPHRETS